MGALFRIIICFGTALMLMTLIVTGRIGLFINPRLLPFVLVGTVLLVLLGLVQVWNAKSPALHPVGKWGYLMLLLPVATYLFAQPGALDASMATKKGVNYLSPEAMQTQQRVLSKEETELRQGERSREEWDDRSLPDDDSAWDDPPEEDVIDVNPYYDDLIKELKNAPLITLDDDHYIDRLTTIQMYNSELSGKPTEVKGFVFRADNMPDDVILVSRYAMTCCAADASVIGVFASFPGSDTLKEGDWIEVKGPLGETTIDESRVPLVEADGYREIEAPKDPYVYANY
ncbi:TIGR03943 family putative permease subunit [Desmospora profundinema]|uniref:Repeat protein (TIGR03943 family) n=1 Tax=Desmospora profundinema TaxID=1571184 RepID=A0ABU1IMI4_9BACL|nr:TIGR03943 family protein [Desmospora profundinema]MDR6225992.1 putative repeat protein (TIGR03943 family) [Desmospora profundinema]